ncbi:MAG TPA: hypothetical protein VKT78_10755 [Fimbriimonadaceae bacterium]|nr:hypothetical protein [Fimbriimonadaceae bacterium]
MSRLENGSTETAIRDPLGAAALPYERANATQAVAQDEVGRLALEFLDEVGQEGRDLIEEDVLDVVLELPNALELGPLGEVALEVGLVEHGGLRVGQVRRAGAFGLILETGCDVGAHLVALPHERLHDREAGVYVAAKRDGGEDDPRHGFARV